MRQPTSDRKRRARQQRLLRTGTGIVVAVGVIALAAALLGGGGGDEPSPDTPAVSFAGPVTGYNDAGNVQRARPIPRRTLTAEGSELTGLLNQWYQRTFVDPSVFEPVEQDEEGLPMFPPPDLLEMFAEEARAAAAADVDALTLGSERETFARVEPTRARAKVAIYFRKSDTPTLATADVTFEARGTFKDETAFPVTIVHHATFHFTRQGGSWVVTFYEADQQQDSILPPPTASPTETP